MIHFRPNPSNPSKSSRSRWVALIAALLCISLPGSVIAASPRAGQSDILEARETSQSTSTQKFEQSGITVSLSTPMLSTMQSVQSLVQAAGQTKSDRSVALAGAAAALTLYNAANPPKTTAAKDLASADAAALSISISLGQQSSQSTTHTRVDQARGSSITAGGNLNLTATGAGDKNKTNSDSNTGNITLQGTRVKVAGDATFSAENQIKLLAASNTTSEQSTNSSSSSSIGVSFGIGSKGAGPSFTVAANQASGQGQGSGTSYTPTQLDIGNTVTLKSGGDTTIKGAVVNATTANATVGGNLSIESVQASNNYTSSQTSSGGSLTVGASGFGATASASKSNIDSNYQSTNQTSGIKAGDGGFNVNIGGNTTLTGGVITSTQKAVDDKANSFQTGTGANGGTLTVKDLNNSASFNASSQGGTIGIGSSLSATSIGVGNASGNAASTTQAGITGIAGNTAARTGDAGTGIKTIFNKDEVQADVNAQVVITGAFGQQASSAWGKFSNDKLADAVKNQNSDDIACWSANGACRIAGHAVIGGATGGVDGAAGAATGTYVAPSVAEFVKSTGITGPAADLLTGVLTTGVGVAVGGPAGGVAAFNEVNNNYLTSGQWNDLAKALKDCGNSRTCQKNVTTAFTQLSQTQDNVLALCGVTNDCTKQATAVTEGTAQQMALVSAGQLPQSYAAVGGGDLNAQGNRLVNNPSLRNQVGNGLIAQHDCTSNPESCGTTPQGVGQLAIGGVKGVIRSPIDLANTGPTAVNGLGYIVDTVKGNPLTPTITPLPYPDALDTQGPLQEAGAVGGSVAGGSLILGGANTLLQGGKGTATSTATTTATTTVVKTEATATTPASSQTIAATGEGAGANGGVAAGTAGDSLAVVAKPTYVFRGDGRPPAQIFDEGFKASGTNTDVLNHATTNTNSGLISTSSTPNVAREFADVQVGGYVYTVRKPPQALDVNATLGAKSPYPQEFEIAVPGAIRPQDILGARQVGPDGKFVGPFVKNTGFQP